MKCRICSVEMFIDKVTKNEQVNEEIFTYKCPNPQCGNYGYGKVKADGNESTEERSEENETG